VLIVAHIEPSFGPNYVLLAGTPTRSRLHAAHRASRLRVARSRRVRNHFGGNNAEQHTKQEAQDRAAHGQQLRKRRPDSQAAAITAHAPCGYCTSPGRPGQSQAHGAPSVHPIKLLSPLCISLHRSLRCNKFVRVSRCNDQSSSSWSDTVTLSVSGWRSKIAVTHGRTAHMMSYEPPCCEARAVTF
jgi:hypothetical protein